MALALRVIDVQESFRHRPYWKADELPRFMVNAQSLVDRCHAQGAAVVQIFHEERQTVEHTFGTLKSWMGATHFLTKTVPRVRTEVCLHVLAYNLKRMIQMLGVQPLITAMQA